MSYIKININAFNKAFILRTRNRVKINTMNGDIDYFLDNNIIVKFI